MLRHFRTRLLLLLNLPNLKYHFKVVSHFFGNIFTSRDLKLSTTILHNLSRTNALCLVLVSASYFISCRFKEHKSALRNTLGLNRLEVWFGAQFQPAKLINKYYFISWKLWFQLLSYSATAKGRRVAQSCKETSHFPNHLLGTVLCQTLESVCIDRIFSAFKA